MQQRHVEPGPDLFEQHYQYQRTKQRRAWFKFTAVLFIVAAVTSGAWFGFAYFSRVQLSSQIPATVRDQVDFPLYLPAKSGYPSNEQSFSYSSGVVLFSASGGDSQLTISEQRKTSDFDLSKFSTAQGLAEVRQLIINGNAVLFGKLRGHDIAIMDTGQTIVTITGAAAESSTSLELAVRTLQKI